MPIESELLEITQASPRQVMEKRLALLEAAAESPDLRAYLVELCRRDILFWFNWFCWTFDPRLSQPHQPFKLYPFQVETLRDIVQAMENGEDLLIEKSRDMGISWLILLAFQHFWLFKPGANFHLGSRKMEAVDRKGDISTLLEKMRYNLERLPAWMRPSGYQPHQHDNLGRLLNPANGNVLTGESSNENFGRGGRYKAVLFDEFPFWPDQHASYASAGQSTPCRLTVGTPYGKNNRFAELRFSEQVKTLSIHWRQHPHKDEQWYLHQQTRMTEEEVARELDINYHLSHQDRVFKNFSPINKARLTWNPQLRLVRSWDFGYHCPACLFLQIDADGRVLILFEIVGREEMLLDFAQRVLSVTRERFPQSEVEDICDPAGAQHSDKSTRTSIEILNSLGVYPYFDRSGIRDGIELIRMKLSERVPHAEKGDCEEQYGALARPGLMVDVACVSLIEAFEGGYRYPGDGKELPVQEHPYEDVMDCLRYAVMAKCAILQKSSRKPRRYQSQNRYTGY